MNKAETRAAHIDSPPQAEMRRIVEAEKRDLFDVTAYVAYALPAMTREDRAAKAKSIFSERINRKR
jgi:type I restriction enzyme, R subunit